jgi:hypothetical protein
MTTRILCLTLLPLAIACGGGGGDPPANNGGNNGGNATIFFAQDIQPILTSDCITCHGGSGGLDLQSWAGLNAGGASGATVVAGDPDNSLLIKRLEGTIGPQMPLGGLPPLSAPEIETIKQWIQEGAQDN